MGLPAWPRASMTSVRPGFIDEREVKWRKLRPQQIFYAFSARIWAFHVCQFLVRLPSGAHTRTPMTDVFEYRPKFVDVRVKKPGAARPTRSADYAEGAAQPCDHIGCKRPGSHRAPKGREHGNQYWHFCLEHVSAYNSRWNYFAGMSDSEWSDFQAREEIGHRPTWTLRGGRGDRLAAAARGFQDGKGSDPFGMFTNGEPAPSRARQRRRLTRLQAKALEVLALQEEATAGEIRARYAELVKRWHPDSNGGDRGAETNLQRVLAAYQTLKAGGLV